MKKLKEYCPRQLILALGLSQALLVMRLAWYHAPVSDEAAHWAAGVYSWQTGRFDLYPVNPPLIKLIASLPTLLLNPVTEWRAAVTRPRSTGDRAEWSVSVQFIRDNADQVRVAMFLARLTILPWVFLGTWISWRWSRELYGERAACVAVLLWCLSPTLLALSGTILPDVPAAAGGLAAAYAFRRWLKIPNWDSAIIAGIALGVAELTKLTWVIFFALWPALWLIKPTTWRNQRRRGVESLQCLTVIVVGVAVINLGYVYTGTGERLESLSFASRTFGGADSVLDGHDGGNRFSGCLLGRLPIPVPRDYLLGIDLQKTDFERGLASYLCGEWSSSGWWYYYAVCCIFKIPIGSWIIVGVSLANRLGSPRGALCIPPRRSSPIRFEELLLLMPALCVMLLVSSQTGINRHFRYLLPAFPFVGVLASRAAFSCGRVARLLVAVAIFWNVVTGLLVFPHSMAYFNELAGGPAGGRKYLLDSNLDWGQDIWELGEWCALHPEISSLRAAFRNSYSQELLQSHMLQSQVGRVREFNIFRLDDRRELSKDDLPLMPGWYAISIHRMHEPDRRYASFLTRRPVAVIGHTIAVFHIAADGTAPIDDSKHCDPGHQGDGND